MATTLAGRPRSPYARRIVLIRPDRSFSRRAAALLVAVAGVAGVATGPAIAQAGAASAFRVTLRAPTHHPRADRAWPVSFTATYRGRPTRVRLRYEYLFGGKVVSRQNPGSLKSSGYRFTGHYTDRGFVWPARAAGVRLTFRAVISGRYGTRRLDYWVQVTR